MAYRIAAAWFFLFSINALCTAVIAALVGKDWTNLPSQDKFIIVVSVLGNWTGTIMAFLSRTSQKLAPPHPPTSDTAFLPKPPAV